MSNYLSRNSLSWYFNEQINILNAVKDGKEIQVYSTTTNQWYDVDRTETLFLDFNNRYRIKPETPVIIEVALFRSNNLKFIFSRKRDSIKDSRFYKDNTQVSAWTPILLTEHQ